MSEQLIIDNSSKTIDDYQGLWADNGEAGLGIQFILYTTATITHITFKLRRYNSPTGSLIAKLYGSNGNFRSPDAYAENLIAQSLNTIDVSELAGSFQNVAFYFDSTELTAGVYFVCLFSANLDNENGYVQLAQTSRSSAFIGYLSFWWQSLGRWGSYMEWD